MTVILILVMIFSFLAFIKNSGDEVYYDAGDEDTTEVVQEMVDVLTLCHATFRSALSNQFGGGSGGGSASGTDEMMLHNYKKGINQMFLGYMMSSQVHGGTMSLLSIYTWKMGCRHKSKGT